MINATEVLNGLESMRRRHLKVEDCWYSCAIHTCNDNRRSDVCDCGATKTNEVLDQVIQQVRDWLDG